jgi:hypothetical protein
VRDRLSDRSRHTDDVEIPIPDFAADSPGADWFDLTGDPIIGAALDGIAYLGEAGEQDGGSGRPVLAWNDAEPQSGRKLVTSRTVSDSR